MIYLPRAVIMYYHAYIPRTLPRNAGRKCNAFSGRSEQSIRVHAARRVYSSLLSGYLLHRVHDEKFIRRFNTDARTRFSVPVSIALCNCVFVYDENITITISKVAVGIYTGNYLRGIILVEIYIE